MPRTDESIASHMGLHDRIAELERENAALRAEQCSDCTDRLLKGDIDRLEKENAVLAKMCEIAIKRGGCDACNGMIGLEPTGVDNGLDVCYYDDKDCPAHESWDDLSVLITADIRTRAIDELAKESPKPNPHYVGEIDTGDTFA